MAQDILRFHCVYWPAMLLAAGYDVPKQIFIHGYLLLDDRKISKSLGNSLDPLDADRRLRRRSAALLVRARGPVRAGRQRLARRHRRAVRERARQRPRQPALAHDRDGRQVPRRPAPGRPGRLVGDRGRDRGRAAGERRHRPRSTSPERSTASGSLVRALNRHVTETQPWELAKDEANADAARPGALRPLRRAAGRGGRARSRICPRPRRRSSTRSASRRSSAGSTSRTGSSSPAIRSRRRRRSSRASSCRTPTRRDRRAMIDTHAHLGDDAAEVLARARDAGVDPRDRRRDEARRRARRSLARAEAARRRPLRASASTRTRRRASTSAALDELRELLAHPRAVAVGETGLDYFRDYAPPAAQQRALRRPARARARAPASRSSSTRARPTTTRARASLAHDGPVILHCFSSPPLLDAALERGWYVSFAGNVTYKNAYDLRDGGPPRARPSGCSPRPTARISRRRRCAASRTSRRTSCTRSPRSPRCAASTRPSSRRRSTRNADEVFGL